nr:unnamed protein product [Callosobruchus analis]
MTPMPEFDFLTVQELNASMISLVKIAQAETFKGEIAVLTAGQTLKPKHQLLMLNSFVDSDGVLRVGGRIKFSSFLTQVEATLNSRSMYPMSLDPNDFEPLPPGRFSIRRPMTMVRDPECDDKTKLNQLSRFQLIQQLHKGFWKQRSKMYLNHLQHRPKWTTPSRNIKTGSQLVVLKHNNIPPCKWLLGRIVEVHPGSQSGHRQNCNRTLQTSHLENVSIACRHRHEADASLAVLLCWSDGLAYRSAKFETFYLYVKYCANLVGAASTTYNGNEQVTDHFKIKNSEATTGERYNPIEYIPQWITAIK